MVTRSTEGGLAGGGGGWRGAPGDFLGVMGISHNLGFGVVASWVPTTVNIYSIKICAFLYGKLFSNLKLFN